MENREISRSIRGNPWRMLLVSLLVTLFISFPGEASADSIHGLLEFIYNNNRIDITDSSGVNSRIKSNGFQQRYNLAFDKTIYPSLVFSGGGQFEDASQSGNTDGVKNKSDNQRISPYLDLILKNPFISSGIGYRRREDTSKSNGVDAPKNTQETYLANMGWHPSELPSLSVFYSKRFLYDEFRTSRDIETDNYTWISDYRSIKGFEANYSGNYSVVKDNIIDSEVQSLTNNGRAAYSGSALNNRVFYQASYNINLQNSTITANGAAGGTFFFPPQTIGVQLFAVTPSGLNTVTDGSLQPNSASDLVNLVAPLPPPANQNNIGLSFNGDTQMDSIFLSITSILDTTVNPAVRRPPTVGDLQTFYSANSSLFPFLIYTSQNGTIWGPLAGITPTSVTVGNNPANPTSDEVGFIISFPQQTTAFVKVVQTPPTALPIIPNPPSTIDPRNIFVSSIQVFRTVRITTPGSSMKTSSISGIYDMNVKALLLDDPNLAYDMSFTYTHSKSDTSSLTTTYLFNNGLNYAKHYGDIWTVSARVTDEVSVDTQSKIRNTVSYNAGVTAVPLPTLVSSLVYGGRMELFEGHTRITNSIYQNNTAELYRGLNVNLGAGYSKARSERGQNSDSLSITVGTEITPNRDFTLNINYQDLTSNQTGGGEPDRSSFNRSINTTASYRLSDALFLTGGYSLFMQDDTEDVTLQNYGVSWSPFRGGDLQFNFAFSEAYNSGDNQKERNISPSVRWNIRPGSTLDASYNILDSTSSSAGKINSESFGAQLRITF